MVESHEISLRYVGYNTLSHDQSLAPKFLYLKFFTVSLILNMIFVQSKKSKT